MRWWARPARCWRPGALAALLALLLVTTSCGSGDVPSAQQLGGQAAADLERTWEVALEVTEVVPADTQLDESSSTRTYRFERAGRDECRDTVEVEADGDAEAIPAGDLTVETDLSSCVGTATLEVAGATVHDLAVAQVDETTFTMSYEARVPCLDEAGAPVDDLVQVHELEWQLDATDAPDLLTGELAHTIRTDPGCAPPPGQQSGSVQAVRATPVEPA